MVGWGVIPDQQLGHRGAHLAQRLHDGRAVVLAAALAHERDELAGGRGAGAVHDPAGVAARDHHDPLLTPARPPGAQRRVLAPPSITGRAETPTSCLPRLHPPFTSVFFDSRMMPAVL